MSEYLPELLTGLRTERNALRQQVTELRQQVENQARLIAGYIDANQDLREQVAALRADAELLNWLDCYKAHVDYGRVFETGAEYERYRYWFIRSEHGGNLRDCIRAAMQEGR